MAHSYTPGLRVTSYTTLQRRRILPLKGDVIVKVGDRVRRDDVVARTDLPGDIATANVVNRLGIQPSEIGRYMLKKEGEPVEEGELLAETRPFITWFRSQVKSPITGTVETISSITGQVLLRRPPRPVAVMAYVDGTVAEVISDEGVVVETAGAFVQGIFGVGGEAWGPVVRISKTADEVVTPDMIAPEHHGAVLVCGALATLAVLRRAIAVGAAGVIAGGINADDLKELLGYDLGVAITGTEEIGTTIIVTEGFGRISIADRTFDVLCGCAGQVASINGATQIRAGVQRPEIISPCDMPPADANGYGHAGGLAVGDPVRIIREPHFGRLGTVAALPSELRRVESETVVRVLVVAFSDGTQAVVPRANVESITR